MGLYERYQTDEQMEEEGQWVRFDDDVELRIASRASKRADRALQAHRKEHHRHYLSGKTIPLDVRTDAEIRLAAACITDWRGAGVTGPDGAPMSYNRENATKLMTDLRELRDQVIFAASQAETYRRQRIDDLGKTPAPSSVANSSTVGSGATS